MLRQLNVCLSHHGADVEGSGHRLQSLGTGRGAMAVSWIKRKNVAPMHGPSSASVPNIIASWHIAWEKLMRRSWETRTNMDDHHMTAWKKMPKKLQCVIWPHADPLFSRRGDPSHHHRLCAHLSEALRRRNR